MRFFISYKSEDVNLVRGVAERMMALGVDVWFAEYRILPENYEQFEEILGKGLREATHAIVFTNRRWSESTWCRFEIKRLLDRIRDKSNIIEICIPKEKEPHQKFPALSAYRSILFFGNHLCPKDDELDNLVVTLCTHIGLSRPARWGSIISGKKHFFTRYGVELDTGPLQPSASRSWDAMVHDPTSFYRSATFMGKISGIEVTLNCHVWPFDSVRHLSITQEQANDDRAVYTAYLKYAGNWLKYERIRLSANFRAEGLHLVFIGGSSQFAITYCAIELSDHKALWERRYTISLSNPERDLCGEANLVFAAKLKGNRQQQLKQICHLGPYLDSIARSFYQRPQTKAEKIANNLPIFTVRVAYLVAAIIGILNLTATSESIFGPFALAMISGYLCTDIIMLVTRPLYRQLLWSMRPMSDELYMPSVFERVSDDFYHELMSVPIGIFTNLAAMLRDFLRRPLQLLTLVALVLLTFFVWQIVEKNSAVILTLFFLAILLGSALNVFSVQNWISKKKKR